MKNKLTRCKEFTQEFGSPQKTRTVNIAQTVGEVYGYWYDGETFMIIKRDQTGKYDPVDARYIYDKEYKILTELAMDVTF